MSARTIAHHIKDLWHWNAGDRRYFFCSDPDCDIIYFADDDSGIILRFIEYMDVGCSNDWRIDDVVPAVKILDHIALNYPLQQIGPNYMGEVAERWRYADGSGEIGVIASVTQAFCHKCSRARLSTDGKLYTCLFATAAGANLREPPRRGGSERELTSLIADCWSQRNYRYSLLSHAATGAPEKN